MKYLIIAQLFLFLSFFSTKNAYSQAYSVQFRQINADTLFSISIYNSNEEIIAHTTSKDTLLQFTSKKIKTPIIYFSLGNEEKLNKVYLSTTQDTIKIHILGKKNYTFADPVNQKSLKIYKKKRYYSTIYMNIYRQAINPSTPKNTQDSLYNLYRLYQDSLKVMKLTEIKKMPQSYSVLDYLLIECKAKAHKKDTLLAIVKLLDATYYAQFKEFEMIKKTLTTPTLEVGDTITKLPICSTHTFVNKNKEKPVFVFFWDSECKDARMELEKVKQWTEKNKNKATIIGVNLDYDISNYQNYIKQNKLKFKNYHCNEGSLSQISNLFWTSQTPYGIAIKNGILAQKDIYLEDFLNSIK